MRLEEYFSDYFINELTQDKEAKIEIRRDAVLITAGMFIRARHKRDCLPVLYQFFKDGNPTIATQIMAQILGGKDE
jgi:hypothetical protein